MWHSKEVRGINVVFPAIILISIVHGADSVLHRVYSKKTYKQAVEFCRNSGSRLILPTNEQENARVQRVLALESMESWLDLVTSHPAFTDRYENWAKGNPAPSISRCPIIKQDGRWASELCTRRMSFVCESAYSATSRIARSTEKLKPPAVRTSAVYLEFMRTTLAVKEGSARLTQGRQEQIHQEQTANRSAVSWPFGLEPQKKSHEATPPPILMHGSQTKAFTTPAALSQDPVKHGLETTLKSIELQHLPTDAHVQTASERNAVSFGLAASVGSFIIGLYCWRRYKRHRGRQIDSKMETAAEGPYEELSDNVYQYAMVLSDADILSPCVEEGVVNTENVLYTPGDVLQKEAAINADNVLYTACDGMHQETTVTTDNVLYTAGDFIHQEAVVTSDNVLYTADDGMHQEAAVTTDNVSYTADDGMHLEAAVTTDNVSYTADDGMHLEAAVTTDNVYYTADDGMHQEAAVTTDNVSYTADDGMHQEAAVTTDNEIYRADDGMHQEAAVTTDNVSYTADDGMHQEAAVTTDNEIYRADDGMHQEAAVTTDNVIYRADDGMHQEAAVTTDNVIYRADGGMHQEAAVTTDNVIYRADGGMHKEAAVTTDNVLHTADDGMHQEAAVTTENTLYASCDCPH